MSSGKNTKYLKYAIGEIILVVIGILIALSINNWNEARKLKGKEIALLTELHQNLNKTHTAIRSSLDYNQKHLDYNEYLVNIIKNNNRYNKKLDTVFGNLPYWNTPYLTQNAYHNIKTLGVDIISNKSLKTKIVELHEEVLPKLLNDWDRWEWDINQSIVMPFFAKHIEGSLNDRYIARPNNFETLRNSEELRNILAVIYRTRIYGIELMEVSLLKINEVQNQIRQELNLSHD